MTGGSNGITQEGEGEGKGENKGSDRLQPVKVGVKPKNREREA